MNASATRAAEALRSVGLTGNVASGKSTVAALWRDAGVPTVSADDLARDVVAPGSAALREVRETFGPRAIRDDGTLDRTALRDIVFRNDVARRRLEAILHPRIEALREAWLAERRAEGAPLVVAEIPLLFEAGLEGRFDHVVFVDAPEEARLRRLVEERDLDPPEARRIMDAQMPAERKIERSDFVLRNDSTLDELRVRAGDLLQRLRAS